MTVGALTFHDIEDWTCGRTRIVDVACPWCGPEKRSSINQRRKVLRIWRLDEGFATFHCARCGESGHTRDQSAVPPDREKLERARAEATEREQMAARERLGKARWLWSIRTAVDGTVAEKYLRDVRGCCGPLPATLGFLAGRNGYPPAMIAAFGQPEEPAPGHLTIAQTAVTGVHITRIAADGRGKAGTERDKIMLGRSSGSPIVLAPMNDLLGLAITEGIEDALTVHLRTGLGTWAAGSASHMPALVDAVPGYVDCVTVYVDDDDAGRKHASILIKGLRARRIEVIVEEPAR
jgi:hypothetical protein